MSNILQLKKLLFLTFIFCTLAPCLFGKRQQREYFLVQNNSSSVISFTFECVGFEDRGFRFYHDGVLFDTVDAIIAATPDQNHEIQPGDSFEMMYFMVSPFTRNIGALELFKNAIARFTVYDENGNIIMTMDDLQEGTVIIHRFSDDGILFIDSIQEREGNITTEYFGAPGTAFSSRMFTIEITDVRDG